MVLPEETAFRELVANRTSDLSAIGLEIRRFDYDFRMRIAKVILRGHGAFFDFNVDFRESWSDCAAATVRHDPEAKGMEPYFSPYVTIGELASKYVGPAPLARNPHPFGTLEAGLYRGEAQLQLLIDSVPALTRRGVIPALLPVVEPKSHL